MNLANTFNLLRVADNVSLCSQLAQTNLDQEENIEFPCKNFTKRSRYIYQLCLLCLRQALLQNTFQEGHTDAHDETDVDCWHGNGRYPFEWHCGSCVRKSIVDGDRVISHVSTFPTRVDSCLQGRRAKRIDKRCRNR